VILFFQEARTPPPALCDRLVHVIERGSLLARLVQSWAGINVRVDHGEVGWCHGQVHVSDGNEHGSVDGWVAGKSAHVWLDGHARVPGHVREWRVGGIELRHPQDKRGGRGGGRGDVAVVWPNGLTWALPLEIDLTAWVAEGNRPVVSDGWGTVLVVSGRIDATLAADLGGNERVGAGGWLVDSLLDLGWAGLIENAQGREVLPR